MDRTGRAIGNLNPVIYFQNQSGYCILAPQQVGHDTSLARKIHQERYSDWLWCEAGTWSEVTKLQKKLQDQALAERTKMRDTSMAAYDAEKRRTADELRQRMQSASCTPFEREFIQHYLSLGEDKRKKYEQRFTEYQTYLWAVEQDSGRKVDEKMPMQPGEFWRE